MKKRKEFFDGMKIYLIRHSESIDDIENCYGGIADFDLTENGKDKVKQYKKETDNYGIERIYTSPYKRAYQTAQILTVDKKIELDDLATTILDYNDDKFNIIETKGIKFM